MTCARATIVGKPLYVVRMERFGPKQTAYDMFHDMLYDMFHSVFYDMFYVFIEAENRKKMFGPILRALARFESGPLCVFIFRCW